MNKFQKSFYNNKKTYDFSSQKLTIQIYDLENYIITGSYTLFDESLKKLLKEYSSFYSPVEKGWIFKKNFYFAMIDKIKKCFPAILIQEIPDLTLKALQPIRGQISFKIQQQNVVLNYKDSDNKKLVQSLPKNLYEKLYKFQEEGVQFAVKNFGRLLIADEMGVGKTIQAISLAYLYRESWPLLIICPSSLILNWRDEVKKWLNRSIKNSEIQIVQKSSCEFRADASIIIISYDLCTKLSKELETKGFGVAIADEAHYLKNPQAKRTEFITPLLQKTKHVLLLTGTPALAKPKELFSLLHILRPDIFRFFKEFGSRYCDPKPSKWTKGLDFEGASNVRELHFLLNQNLMIRRLKRDVLSELPAKRRQKIEINVDARISNDIQKLLSKGTMIDSALDDLMEETDSLFFKNQGNTHGDFNEQGFFNSEKKESLTKQQINETLSKCYMLTGLAKLKGINQYISDITENECKFLIFAHHTEVLDGIESELQRLKLKYIRIDGNTPMNKRHDLVQQYQEVPMIRIALLSISATGVGLTLTAASTILFAEMHWTPAIMLQAEDRAHRIGQINCVNCHYLYGSGTLDDKLYLKLEQKLCIVSEMIDGLKKDLEVEEYLKKGDKGAISLQRPKEKTLTQAKIPHKEGENKEKITAFFEVVGTKSSNNKTNPLEKTEEKTNYCEEEDDELPDLELLDQLVEEHKKSSKKHEENVMNIQGFKKVLQKEYRNNLVDCENLSISSDSANNSLKKPWNFEQTDENSIVFEDIIPKQGENKENCTPKGKKNLSEKVKREDNLKLAREDSPKTKIKLNENN